MVQNTLKLIIEGANLQQQKIHAGFYAKFFAFQDSETLPSLYSVFYTLMPSADFPSFLEVRGGKVSSRSL